MPFMGELPPVLPQRQQRTTLLTLPNEVLDMVLSAVPMLMLPALVVALAPHCVRLCLVPPIPAAELHSMRLFAAFGLLPRHPRSSLRLSDDETSRSGSDDGFHRLPAELWYLVGDRLATLEHRLAFAVAIWPALAPAWRRHDLQARRFRQGVDVAIVQPTRRPVVQS